MLTRVLAACLSLLCALLASAPASSQERSEVDEGAVVLVASPKLITPAYYHTVVLAAPLAGGRHVGFIVNRPTELSLASLFPEHAPSKEVVDPVYFGGPMGVGAVFAVVRDAHNPGGGSITMMDDLQLVMRADLVDHIIESTPNDARYFVGMIRWVPGELREELRRGLWHVLDADSSIVFRKRTDRLWEDLLSRTRAVTASLPRHVRFD